MAPCGRVGWERLLEPPSSSSSSGAHCAMQGLTARAVMNDALRCASNFKGTVACVLFSLLAAAILLVTSDAAQSSYDDWKRAHGWGDWVIGGRFQIVVVAGLVVWVGVQAVYVGCLLLLPVLVHCAGRVLYEAATRVYAVVTGNHAAAVYPGCNPEFDLHFVPDAGRVRRHTHGPPR